MSETCNCTVCRYVRKQISREEAIRLVKADIDAEEGELRNNPDADKWALEVNLDFDRMFLHDLLQGGQRMTLEERAEEYAKN